MRIRKYIILFIFLFLISFNLQGESIEIVKIYKDGNKLYMDGVVKEILPEDIINYLKNGVKVTLVYYIEIRERKPFYFLFDTTIYSKSYKKVIYYNLWEKKYYLKFENKILKLKSVKELNENLQNIKRLYIINYDKIKNKKNLYIRLKVKLQSIKLFPPLSWIFDLVTVREFETKWAEKDLNVKK